MRHSSPLRYPGGKARLADFLVDLIDLNDLRGATYFEPYAGGAGAALKLLKEGVVSEIHLNDADVRIYAFWSSILEQPRQFLASIRTVPLTIEEWRKQRAICLHPDQHERFDVGFAAFYMNRCNRSGVLRGAGPIGGYEQKGKWRMDVRFNRETLARRILNVVNYRRNIHVYNQDAVAFLKAHLPRGRRRRQVLVYLDPPYVNKGQRLYLNAYQRGDHRKLAKYLLGQQSLPWIMSYDDSDLVRSIYRDGSQALMEASYTLQTKRSTHEILIAPHHVLVPLERRIGRQHSQLQKIA